MADNKPILICGRNSVKEAIRTDRVKRIMLNNGFHDHEILQLIEEKKISFVFVNPKELDRLSNAMVHQGIVAEIKPYLYSSLEEIIYLSKKVDYPIVIILDGINDSHNFGAILRSAEIFGATGVIISKHHQVPLNATVGKTSAGAINYVPVAQVNNLTNAISKLKENGFWIVSSDGSGESNYDDISYDFPTVLVIGSEGEGVSRLVLKNSDYIVKIPMSGEVNSLNASVAAGILMSEINRQCRKRMKNSMH